MITSHLEWDPYRNFGQRPDPVDNGGSGPMPERNGYNILQMAILGVVVVTNLATSSTIATAQNVRLPEIRTPVAEIRTIQDQRKDEILQLLKLALDESAPADKRASAVSSLGGINYDFLLANAEPLIKSKAAAVALATVRVLGGQIAMLPSDGQHAHGSGSQEADALTAYQKRLVSRTVEVLRLALVHPDLGVLEQASSILASRGDAQSLAAIQGMIDRGDLPPKKGIGYLTLAPTNVASPFIEKYLSADRAEVRAAAAAQLAYNPNYTAQVRALALAPKATGDVVRAALPGLAVTDRAFLEYGVALSQNARVTPEVRSEAVKAVVSATISRKLDPAIVNAIASSLNETARNTGSSEAAKAIQVLKQRYNLQ